MSIFSLYFTASNNPPTHPPLASVFVTGSLRVKGQIFTTGSMYATGSITTDTYVSASQVNAGWMLSGSQLNVTNASITGSLFISRHSVDGFEPEVFLSKNDSTILADDPIGTVYFRGEDSDSAGTGASISATAYANWLSGERRPTDIKFATQDSTTTDTLIRPRLIISASGGIGADIHIHTPVLQVGVGGDGNQGKTAEGVQARVSACTTGDEGPAGIEIEAGGTTNTSALTFARDNNTSERQGWYVDWSADFRNRLTYRASDAADIGDSPIAISDPAEFTDGSGGWTVRVGGGGSFMAANSGWDKDASLLVTSSYFSRQSLITIRNMNRGGVDGDGHADAVPGVMWNYQQRNGVKNNGIWTMGIEPYNKSLTIGSPSGGLSTGYNRNTTAMVFGEAGDNTKVGIGGESSTWGPGTGNNVRSLIPSATLHVGNVNNNPYSSMNQTLTQTSTILLDNSINGSGELQATLTFDVSTDSDIEYHSAHIACVNDGTAEGHTSYLSTGLYDGTGNKDSTRSRMRIDSQGGVIMLSGTMPGAGVGWPRNGKSFYDIDAADVPSGSLTLISLMDGTYGKSPATLNLVSWTGTNGNRGAITTGDSLGRIVWHSSDSQLDKEEAVSAFIETIAAGVHNGSNLSPGAMRFYTRNTAEAVPSIALELHPDKDVSIPEGDLIIGGDIKVFGNDIFDSGNGAAITFDGSQNTSLAGDLAVVGRDISSGGTTGTANIFVDTGGNFINIGGDGSTTSVKTLQNVAGDFTDQNDNTVLSFAGDGTIDGIGQINQDVVIGGATPRLTIGDGGNEVTMLAFDGPVGGDWRIGWNNAGAQDLEIGRGFSAGALAAMKYTTGSYAKPIEGMPWGASVQSNLPTSYTAVKKWMKIAETDAIDVSGANRGKAVTSLLLVRFEGESSPTPQTDEDWASTMTIKCKWVLGSSFNNPYFNDPNGTCVTVDYFDYPQITSAVPSPRAFNPAGDVNIVFRNNGLNFVYAEMWIRTKADSKDVFVTHLGGTGTGESNKTSAKSLPGWRVSTGQEATSKPGGGWNAAGGYPAGAISFLQGRWASKVVQDLIVSGSTQFIGGSFLGVKGFSFSSTVTPTTQHMVAPIGHVNIRASDATGTGDITIGAKGGQIKLGNTTAEYFTFNVDATPELDVTGNFIIDGSGTIEIDAASSILLDAATDITLDAAGDQIYFKDNGTTRFTFNLDSTPEIDVVGAFKLDCNSTWEIEGTGGTLDAPTSGINAYVGNSGLKVRPTLDGAHWGKLFIYGHGTSAYPLVMQRRSRGTETTPTGVLNNDVLGTYQFQGYNTNAGDYQVGAAIEGHVDGTPGNSSTDMPTELRLRVCANGSSTLSTRMQIRADGSIFANAIDNATGANYLKYDPSTDEITYATSTEKTKKNIQDLQLDYAPLMSMRPRTFDWRDGSGSGVVGFIAEEMYTSHAPSAALGADLDWNEAGKCRTDEVGDRIKLSENKVPVDWDVKVTVPYLVKIIQDMHARIQDLENS